MWSRGNPFKTTCIDVSSQDIHTELTIRACSVASAAWSIHGTYSCILVVQNLIHTHHVSESWRILLHKPITRISHLHHSSLPSLDSVPGEHSTLFCEHTGPNLLLPLPTQSSHFKSYTL
jgi:hypothetical protein